MVGADVPLWFAGIALVVPALTGLLTLVITARNAAKAFEREAVDRKVARDYETRSDTWRALRADRIELYRKLVAAARKLLSVDQPMSDLIESLQRRAEALTESKGSPSARPTVTVDDLEAWQPLFTEAELIAPNVIPAARAVRKHYDTLLAARREEYLAQIQAGTPPKFGEPQLEAAKSREYVDALIKACSADIASMTEPVEADHRGQEDTR